MSVISYFSKHYKQNKVIYIKVEHTASDGKFKTCVSECQLLDEEVATVAPHRER